MDHDKHISRMMGWMAAQNEILSALMGGIGQNQKKLFIDLDTLLRLPGSPFVGASGTPSRGRG